MKGQVLPIPTDPDRSTYNSIQAKNPDVIITPGYLRLEKSLGTENEISFDVLMNQGAMTVNEKRLDLSDAFTITHVGFAIYKIASGGAVQTAQLDSFPNPLVYTGASEAANLQALYNGALSIRVDSTVYVDSLDMYRFYRVGQAQELVDLGGGTGANATGVYQASQWDSEEYVFGRITPTITLSGASKNRLVLTLPDSTDLSGTSSTNYAVLYLRGFLQHNNAKFKG